MSKELREQFTEEKKQTWHWSYLEYIEWLESKLKAVDRQKLIDFSIWDCRMDKDITLDNITKDVDSYLNELKKQ